MGGETVGYSNQYKCAHKTTIVTIPVGYTDGLNKEFSGIGYVLIRGNRYKIVAVCMDQAMIANQIGICAEELILIDNLFIYKSASISLMPTSSRQIKGFKKNVN